MRSGDGGGLRVLGAGGSEKVTGLIVRRREQVGTGAAIGG